jgi:hypothetical protein
MFLSVAKFDAERIPNISGKSRGISPYLRECMQGVAGQCEPCG